MGANFYKEGDFNRICDACGFKVKASGTRKQWNGLIVCKRHWEAQNQQDFLQAKVDKQWVVDPRPDSEPVFTQTGNYLSLSDGEFVTLGSGEVITI